MQPSKTDGVTFRKACKQDLPHIVELLADDPLGSARDDASLPLDDRYLKAFDALACDSNQLLAVADEGGTVIGCLQLSFIPNLTYKGMWRGQVEGVRIAKSRRGQSLGRRFMEWSIAECRARGCGMVQLSTHTTRPEAKRFYESLGFEASHVGMKRML